MERKIELVVSDEFLADLRKTVWVHGILEQLSHENPMHAMAVSLLQAIDKGESSLPLIKRKKADKRGRP